MSKHTQKPCYCDAYLRKDGKPFPHRYLGGKCYGHDLDRPDEEKADRWLKRLMERGYRTIDEKLDDPRHVPYSQQKEK